MGDKSCILEYLPISILLPFTFLRVIRAAFQIPMNHKHLGRLPTLIPMNTILNIPMNQFDKYLGPQLNQRTPIYTNTNEPVAFGVV